MSEFFEVLEGSDEQISAELLLTPGVNFALVHNGVAILRRLALKNTGETTLENLVISVELSAHTGILAGPWRREVGQLPAGRELVWTDDLEDFVPDQTVLATAEEAFPATLTVTVERPWAPAVQTTHRATILAHNEWLAAPALYDSLATFVQPNARAVSEILLQASTILQEMTGDSALSGYQRGPERAVAIAGAIYEALRQHGLTYAVGSLGFEEQGQKVKTSRAVLESRLGNCIDLAVTYAACLEQAGLRPLIWVVSGHAFPGFHRDEERLPESVLLEPNPMINRVESGQTIPVELTGVGAGESGLDFPGAVTAGVEHFRGDPDDLRGVIDINLAHRTGVRPFPSTEPATSQPGATQAVEEDTTTGTASISLPAGFSAAVLGDETDSERIHHVEDDSPARIQKWKKALLDLSLRNPLLNLPRRGKSLDVILPPGGLAILDDLIHDHKPVSINPGDSTSLLQNLQGVRSVAEAPRELVLEELQNERRVYGDITGKSYRSTLRTLQRDARTVEQETGSNYLYLTLGALIHKNSRGEDARAPLFLIPVRIEGGTGRKQYSMVVDGNEIAAPNHCLIEWLRVKDGVQLPVLAEPLLDESGIDIDATLTMIKRGLVEHRLDYRVDEFASLRLLRFSTFQMWKDLTENWETFMESPVVEHLVERPGEIFKDPARHDELKVEFDEAEMQLPVVADGSQMEAISRAENGLSFVLEGPPGTGKSQTIANLISRMVTSGKTMIFVAEKQAALEVVKRRIEKVGLGSFVLDLHGAKQSMRNIRTQLKEAIDTGEVSESSAWQAAELNYRQSIAELSDYPARLHSTNRIGYSAWSAYEEMLAYGEGETIEVPTGLVGREPEVRAGLDQTLERLSSKLRQTRIRKNHPWLISGLRSTENLDRDRLVALAKRLETVRQQLDALPEDWREFLTSLPSPTALTGAATFTEAALAGIEPTPAALAAVSSPDWETVKTKAVSDLKAFRDRRQDVITKFMPKVFTEAPLDQWQIEADEATRGLFGKGKRQTQLRDRIKPFLTPGSSLEAEEAAPFARALGETHDEARNVVELVTASPAISLDSHWAPTDPEAVDSLDAAIHGAEMLKAAKQDTGSRWEPMIALPVPDEQQTSQIRNLADGWSQWLNAIAADDSTLKLWVGDSTWFERWHRDGPVWLEELGTEGLRPIHMWSELQASLDLIRDEGLETAADAVLLAELDGPTLHTAFRRGLAQTALRERLTENGLDFFDGQSHDGRIEEFEKAGSQVRKELPQRLSNQLVKLREQKKLDPARLGELKKQLDRKRGGLTFRELFEKFPDEILGLTPCILMSPASVATFIKPGVAKFDLAVFDEASQIRVPQAIGAMGRAKATVVVGDSKQMPPTNVMEVSRPGEDQTDPVPEDMDSILSECVESGLDQVWLSWHYRSRDESLIAFSNHQYYEGKLSTLPSPGDLPGAGVEWRRVDGTFLRGGSGAERTNEVEATAIVDEIVSRLHGTDSENPSIGVVTFNIQQRDLILNKLEESADRLVHEALARDDGEGIFVKNLENVQGDERDVILFSIAFSKDPTTDQLPLNFGPLSQQGGERRLNVAITRARSKVILFSSFDPSDIELARTNALGTHHLRAYLEVAAFGTDRIGETARNGSESQDQILDEVAEAIVDRGMEVERHVGLSNFTVDLAVRRPGEPLWQVALMLDRPGWASRPTVIDRDGAPELLTKMMGWDDVVRVWLPDWVRDRQAVIDRVIEAVRSAESRPDEPEPDHDQEENTVSETGSGESYTGSPDPEPHSDTTIDRSGPEAGTRPKTETPAGIVRPDDISTTVRALNEKTPEPVADLATTSVDSVPDENGAGGTDKPHPDRNEPGEPFHPFQPREIGTKGDVDLLHSSSRVKELMRDILFEITESEGPIRLDRLARLALKCFTFNRAPKARSEAVTALVPTESQITTGLGIWVWPRNLSPENWQGYRQTVDSIDRSFDEIAPEEVVNAANHVLRSNPEGLTEEILVREVLTALGYRRLTRGIQARINDCFELGIRSSRLVKTEVGLYRAGA